MGRVAAAVAVFALLATPAAAAAAPVDGLHAASAVPPRESGLTTFSEFTAATSGASSSYGPHTDDQRVLYESFRYKPMQFVGVGQGDSPPGDPNVKITRDAAYGVPTITGATDADAFYGIGYAMAEDRLFQMEIFRHVGHGTLAELIGPSGLAMDEEVRRVTEGAAALQAEYNALPADARQRLQRFGDGINAYIQQVQGDSSQMPAEFALLNDLPIKPWTVQDSLGFGEYAGRFFGEFGHGELDTAASLAAMTKKVGATNARKIIDDVYPLNDPSGVTTIPRSVGVFPRHVGHPGSSSRAVVNETVASFGVRAAIMREAAVRGLIQTTVRGLQNQLGLVEVGSHYYIVDA